MQLLDFLQTLPLPTLLAATVLFALLMCWGILALVRVTVRAFGYDSAKLIASVNVTTPPERGLPRPVIGLRHERNDPLTQHWRHSPIEDLGDFVRLIQLRAVHHHDVLVRKLVGALDHFVEVDVAAGARGLERLALVEKRALHDQYASRE